MDYKDKLKLAKEALDSGSYDKETIEYIFPELAESKDEKISKEIIYFLSRNTFQFGEDIDKYKSWIAWLEKQAPKPTWTKKDESKVKEIIYFLDTAKVHYADTTALNDCIDWLNHLNKEQQ